MNPEISVAVAAYNGERYIAEQLDSILNQNIKINYDIVISDDCSTDSTGRILKQYADRFPDKIEVVYNEHNCGVAANFENAIRHCRGRLIALSDQDDYWYPEKLQILSDSLAGEANLAFCDMDIVDKELIPIGQSIWQKEGIRAKLQQEFLKGSAYRRLLYGNVVPGCCIMGKRDFMLCCLPIPDFYLHDEWLILVAALCGMIVPCNRRLSAYRQHEGQQIGASNKEIVEELNYIPDAEWLQRAREGRQQLMERSRRIGASPAAIDFAEKWFVGRNKAEELRYCEFSPKSICRLLLDGSYFKYLSGFKSLGKDLFRLLKSGTVRKSGVDEQHN